MNIFRFLEEVKQQGISLQKCEAKMKHRNEDEAD